jgi:lipopolysaccharide export LptBFGC system permease protein LptF
MSKKPKNSKSAVLMHSVGVFILLMLWILLIFFKSSLGQFEILAFIAMIIITISGLYLLTRMLLKGIKNND